MHGNSASRNGGNDGASRPAVDRCFRSGRTPDRAGQRRHGHRCRSRRRAVTGLAGRVWLAHIAGALQQLPDVDALAIFVVDDDRLVAAASAGMHARALGGLSMDVGARMSGWIAATGQAMVNADAALDLFDVPGCRLQTAIGVACSTPDGRRLVVTLYSLSPQAFSPLHQRLLESAAPFIRSVPEPRPRRGLPIAGPACPPRRRSTPVRRFAGARGWNEPHSAVSRRATRGRGERSADQHVI